MTVSPSSDPESRLETGISYLLIVGVIVSLVLEIAGMIFLYISQGNVAISRDESMYVHGQNFFTLIYDQFHGTKATGVNLITAGIIVLMLTPYLRVIGSAIYFGLVKNFKYVLITLFVLAALTVSLALH